MSDTYVTSSNSTNFAPRSTRSGTSPKASTHKSFTPNPSKMLLKHWPICFAKSPMFGSGRGGNARA